MNLGRASDMSSILTNLDIPKDVVYISLSGFSKYVTQEQRELPLPISIQAYLDPSTLTKKDVPAFRFDSDRIIVDVSHLDDILAFITTALLPEENTTVALKKMHTGTIVSPPTNQQSTFSKEQELAFF